MRKLILLAVASVLALNANAARRLTVAQLEEALRSATAEHRADVDVARQISGMELSERLTAPTLDRMAARLPLQPRTALALQLLSDQSAFLDPPRGEFLATAPPDAAGEQQMLDAARAYSVETWSRLPNFFVSRSTTRFDDGAQVLKQGDWPVRAGMHTVGTTTRQITFRDGKEVADPSAEATASEKSADEVGLRSWGEFGPALTVVLTDMAKRKVSFSHWEQVSGVLAAVFHYEVPRESSHYAVTYSFSREQVIGRTQYGYGGRDRSPQQVANIPRASEIQAYSETPSYHGSIAIDPATGAVLRLTIEAELGKGDPLLRAATAIEYAPVIIGDRQYICPSRSLAISLQPPGRGACGLNSASAGVGANTRDWQGAVSGCGNSPILLINETSFTKYHRLGSTARIVADVASPGPTDPGATNLEHAKANEASAPADNSVVPAAPQPASASSSLSSASQPPASAENPPPAVATAPPSPPPVPAAPVIPEISLSEVDSVPDVPAGASQADTGFSLKVTTRLVDIGLVATDKKGRPVTDLRPEDFEVYDGGRKQEVRFFNAPAAPAQAAASPVAPVEQPEHGFSNRAPEPAPSAAAPAAAEAGGTILLVDESHIAWGDMQNARSHMLKFLGTLPPEERVGLYTMNGLGFHVLVEVTRDHAALIARLKKFMPTAQSQQAAQEEETRNRQSFAYVHNVADLNSVNGNHSDVADAEQSVDPQLLTMGSNPARASLIILAQVARHLASIPGHKNLVWVSSDNVLADWQDQQVGIDKSPKDAESFALRAQEAMNEAHAAVYPFDVSQLEAGAVTADMQHANVQLAPAQAENMATAASAGGGGGGAGASIRDTGTGRINAAMSQDLHPIQGPVRDLATATGGRPIRRSGDLAAALNGIVDDGHATYQLSFSPEGQADDQYHKLTVKLAGRRGVTLRYRTGYLYAKEPATMKDRFRQAIWRPTDVSEIGLNAQVTASGAGASLKLNIVAGDLGMQQRGGRWMDKLDIFFIQRDDAGVHAQVEGQTLGLRLKPSTFQNVLSVGVPFERAVDMHPGMASLRVLVVDENSGRMGSVTVPAGELHPGPLQAKSF